MSCFWGSWRVLVLIVWFSVVSIDTVQSFTAMQELSSLVPSQVGWRHQTHPSAASTTIQRSNQRRPNYVQRKTRDNKKAISSFLTPSQVILKSNLDVNSESSSQSAADNSTSGDERAQRTSLSRSQRRRRRGEQRPKKSGNEDNSNHPAQNNRQKNTKNKSKRKAKLRVTGDLPDVHWRAIPMEHLREHPYFQELPPHIDKLECLEDARYFSQDSWQWDAMHKGRCTTSIAVSSLGFLNPAAGRVLNVPRSWQNGGESGYYRLLQAPIRTLKEMNSELCDPELEEKGRKDQQLSQSIWVEPKRHAAYPYPFASKYTIRSSETDRLMKREKLVASGRIGYGVQMMWGNAQEATALLTALNYFWVQDGDVKLKEIGMCGAGIDLKDYDIDSDLLIGASPDALIMHSNGTVEVLEVKNHCPFFAPANGGSKRAKNAGQFRIRSMNFDNAGIPPQYVPQLMMEMLCVGPECRSAVMVRQTANSGALILRMHRDDEWIREMLYWLDRFYVEYVKEETIPLANFFWERPRYQEFLKRTVKLLGENVERVALVPHTDIQRVLGDAPGVTPLFLD